MCLYFALMYKTLGGYNWSDLFRNVTNNATNAIPFEEPVDATPIIDPDFNDEPMEAYDQTILDSAKELQSSFHGLKAVSFCRSNPTILKRISTNSSQMWYRFLQRMCTEVCSDLLRGGHVSYGLPQRP